MQSVRSPQASRVLHDYSVRYRLRADARIEADNYSDALRRIGEHFLAWAEDTPDDDPDNWVADASLAAAQFLMGSSVRLIPEEDENQAR